MLGFPCGAAIEGAGVTVCQDLRRVWVVQCKSTGHFLHLDLFLVRSLKLAGRAPTLECAHETGRLNLDGDYEVHSFYEPADGRV